MANSHTEQWAVFIDMDNLTVTALESMLSRWRYRQTPVVMRRAYGGLDKLKGASALLQRHGFHVRANHGKGTTDVLLTVEVMDALHAGVLPPVVAIASSDGDFVPLVWRLRDAGHRVVGIAEHALANADVLSAAYHDMEWCDAVAPTTPVAPPQPVSVSTRLLVAATPDTKTAGPQKPKPAPDSALVSASVPQKKPCNSPVTKIPSAPAGAVPLVVDLSKAKAMVKALQPWQPHTVKPLQQAGTLLRAQGLVSGSKPLHAHFRQFPAVFHVMPTTGPARMVKLLKLP